MTTTVSSPQTPAEKHLAAAAGFVSDAIERRNEIIIDTADAVSRRRAGELLDLSPGRVQQIIDEARASEAGAENGGA